MTAPRIRTRSDGAGRRFAGRLLAMLALLMLVLPSSPLRAAHADTHLHASAQALHAAVQAEPATSAHDCALHPCHACGCHAVATVAEIAAPGQPQVGLGVFRPAAASVEPRATTPPRRPPRA